jgi:hypothetical protein
MEQDKNPDAKSKRKKLGGNWEDAIKKSLTVPPLTPDPPSGKKLFSAPKKARSPA